MEEKIIEEELKGINICVQKNLITLINYTQDGVTFDINKMEHDDYIKTIEFLEIIKRYSNKIYE